MNLPKNCDVKILLYNDEPSFGKGVIILLENIEKYGSLSAAYKHMHMSQSKAWKILNRAQDDLGVKLVESTSGGSTGGHSVLTEDAKDYIARYKALKREVDEFSQNAFQKYFGGNNEK